MYYRLRQRVRRFLFKGLLPWFARDLIQLVRRLRIIVGVMVPLSVVLFVVGLIAWQGRLVVVSGLLMNMSGVVRMFLDSEWDHLLAYYAKHWKNPGGPPSYAMREYYADDDPEPLGDESGDAHYPIAKQLYERRGLFMLFVGFAMSLIGALIA